MDNSNFKRSQLSLCPFEAEVASLRYTCRKENHYLRSCPEVLVITDCKEMISRRPRDSFEAVCEQEVPIKLRLGVRTVRAERMMLNTIDPRIEKLAEVGHGDPSYRMMIHHLEQQTESRNLEENSELKKI